MQAEAAMQAAEADSNKTLNQVENQVDVAYRNLMKAVDWSKPTWAECWMMRDRP